MLRKDIKYNDGDIVFIRKDSLLAKIIMFVTRTKFSHVGIIFDAIIGGETRTMIVEAQGGTKRRLLSFSFYDNCEMKIIKAPKDWSDVKDIALQDLGQVEYGWFDAIYIGIREFLNSYCDISIPSANFPGEICSEFVARVYDLEPKNISPGKQFTSLLKAGNVLRE